MSLHIFTKLLQLCLALSFSQNQKDYRCMYCNTVDRKKTSILVKKTQSDRCIPNTKHLTLEQSMNTHT